MMCSIRYLFAPTRPHRFITFKYLKAWLRWQSPKLKSDGTPSMWQTLSSLLSGTDHASKLPHTSNIGGLLLASMSFSLFRHMRLTNFHEIDLKLHTSKTPAGVPNRPFDPLMAPLGCRNTFLLGNSVSNCLTMCSLKPSTDYLTRSMSD